MSMKTPPSLISLASSRPGDPCPSDHLENDRPGLHYPGEAEHSRQHVGDDAQSAADGREQPPPPAAADRAGDRVENPGARDEDHDERRQQELDGHGSLAVPEWAVKNFAYRAPPQANEVNAKDRLQRKGRDMRPGPRVTL
jgi:hypothetical protein